MPTPKQGEATRGAAPRRKPGRPFKTPPTDPRSEPPPEEIAASAHPPEFLAPPSIPFRSFKIALSVFKDQDVIPAKLDRGIWSNKLYSTNLREMLEALRFLGLTDVTMAPTAEFGALVAAYGTLSWPAALRRILESSYAPLLACNVSTLTAGGLLRAIRTTYRTQHENTRKSCNFFIHAAREAALDTGPFMLTTARSRWVDAQHGRRTGSAPPQAEDQRRSNIEQQDSISALLMKLPSYETTWSDDVKRMWFGAYYELIQRLKN
jgi:hypothetical protein